MSHLQLARIAQVQDTAVNTAGTSMQHADEVEKELPVFTSASRIVRAISAEPCERHRKRLKLGPTLAKRFPQIAER